MFSPHPPRGLLLVLCTPPHIPHLHYSASPSAHLSFNFHIFSIFYLLILSTHVYVFPSFPILNIYACLCTLFVSLGFHVTLDLWVIFGFHAILGLAPSRTFGSPWASMPSWASAPSRTFRSPRASMPPWASVPSRTFVPSLAFVPSPVSVPSPAFVPSSGLFTTLNLPAILGLHGILRLVPSCWAPMPPAILDPRVFLGLQAILRFAPSHTLRFTSARRPISRRWDIYPKGGISEFFGTADGLILGSRAPD